MGEKNQSILLQDPRASAAQITKHPFSKSKKSRAHIRYVSPRNFKIGNLIMFGAIPGEAICCDAAAF